MGRFELGPRPWIAGHRGALPAIENTIPSFLRAIAEGADFVECDAQLSADGVVLLHHDETLRTGETGDEVRIEELSFDELRTLPLLPPGGGTGPEAIPSLAALFSALPAATPVNVELKPFSTRPGRLIEATLAVIGARPNVLVSSFDWDLLARLRAERPRLPLAPLAETLSPALPEFAREIGAWGLHLGEAPSGEELRTLELPVLVYTVDDPELAGALFARGVAGVFSDRPGALRAALTGIREVGPGGAGVV